VAEKELPAVALAGAVTVSADAAAGETEIVELVPVIVPVTVSVAVSVRLPAWVNVAAFVNVCVPPSPPVKA
jgi:hypothetical protein